MLNFLTVLILSAASGNLFTIFSAPLGGEEKKTRTTLAPAFLTSALGILLLAASRHPVLFAGPLAVSRQNAASAFWFLAAAFFLLLLASWFAKLPGAGLLRNSLEKLRFFTVFLSVLIFLCAVPGLGLAPSLLFLLLPGFVFSRPAFGKSAVLGATCAGAASWLVSLPLRLPASAFPEGLLLLLSLLAVSAASELVFRRKRAAA